MSQSQWVRVVCSGDTVSLSGYMLVCSGGTMSLSGYVWGVQVIQ